MPAGRPSKAGRHSGNALRRWEPTERQREAATMLHDPEVPNILFDGGARSGKTESIIRFMASRAEQYPESSQIMLRKVRRSAEYSLWPSVVKHYRRYVPRERYRIYDQKMTIVHANDSILMVDGLDDSSRLENILGTEYITVFVNEATQIGYGFIGLLHSRLAQKCPHVSRSGWLAVTKMIADCNPRHKRHWLYRMGVKNFQPDVLDQDIPIPIEGRWSHLHWTPFHNLANLPPKYIETHLDTLPTKIRERMRDGLWTSAEGLVYDNFDEDVNTIETFQITPEYNVIRAIDFGFAAPFCCLWIAVKYDYSHVVIFDEHYYSKRTVNWHAEKIKEKSRHYPNATITLCDWEAENRANLEEHGLNDVEPADKSLLSGIDRVYRALGQYAGRPPVLQVVANCINTVSEFYSYRWQDDDVGTVQRLRSNKDEPVDRDNHAMACVRYVMNYLALEMDVRAVLQAHVLQGNDSPTGPISVRGGYRVPDVSWDNSYGKEGFSREHFE
jgi:PBSX family phage terminase large subunit